MVIPTFLATLLSVMAAPLYASDVRAKTKGIICLQGFPKGNPPFNQISRVGYASTNPVVLEGIQCRGISESFPVIEEKVFPVSIFVDERNANGRWLWNFLQPHLEKLSLMFAPLDEQACPPPF